MSQELYRTWMKRLEGLDNSLSRLLPEQWPATAPSVDRRATVAAMRTAAATRNLGLFLFGWGDGSAAELASEDPVCREKQLNILVFPEERLALAHVFGTRRAEVIFRHPRIMLHLCTQVEDAGQLLNGSFGRHTDIARLAGTTMLDAHPLADDAAKQREAWMPRLRRYFGERLDCLGNDVYDTFMGGKHALMHGRALAQHRRSSDLAGRFAGKSAICLASGPSGHEHLARIREIQHEHVVIIADSILGAALDAGIEPDFVCIVERPTDMHKLFDGIAHRTKATLVALPVVHTSSTEPFAERVAWWWNADDLYTWLKPDEPRLMSGRSAGTLTVALAGHLGCATAWLVGHDLAFRDGKTHAPGAAAFAIDTATPHATSSRSDANYHKCLLDVPRNGGGTVETNGLWSIFRADIETIITIHPHCVFTNLNADCGAVINGTVLGSLPEATSHALDKQLPPAQFDQTWWDSLRPRAAKLCDDLAAIGSKSHALSEELVSLTPLTARAEDIERIAHALDLTKMVSPENSMFFAYVLRAAHRNLMLRLHHNTQVRTLAERNWNQVQVMRMYLKTLPGLVNRLRDELATAVEGFA